MQLELNIGGTARSFSSDECPEELSPKLLKIGTVSETALISQNYSK